MCILLNAHSHFIKWLMSQASKAAANLVICFTKKI